MKKTLYLLVALFASAIFLVACSKGESGSSQSNLDGEYYFYAEYDKKLSDSPWIVIDGKKLTYYYGGKEDSSGTLRYSIDTEKQTLTGEGKVLAYSYDGETGVLSAGIMSSDTQFVKKDSKKYKELKDK